MKVRAWIKSWYMKRPVGTNWAERIDIAIDQGWGFTFEETDLARNWQTCVVGEMAYASGEHTGSAANAFKDRNTAINLGSSIAAYITLCDATHIYAYGKKIKKLYKEIHELELA